MNNIYLVVIVLASLTRQKKNHIFQNGDVDVVVGRLNRRQSAFKKTFFFSFILTQTIFICLPFSLTICATFCHRCISKLVCKRRASVRMDSHIRLSNS